jgi:isopenicillin N synthase-like dioxygenase
MMASASACRHAPRTSEAIMQSSVPLVDLAPWLGGNPAARAGVAAEVDAALQDVGFFLITGHGVPGELRAQVRVPSRAFFALPRPAKQRYAVTVGGRGWLPTGVEANGYAEGTATPPDLKESFAVGADQPTGDPDVDGYWFQPNVYPAEIPALQPAVVAYLARMRELADELLVVCAAALGLERDFFTRHTGHATHTMNVNWYPPMTLAGEPEAGQFRIGPHTDFGTVTILDREPGRGGLQVWTGQDGWKDVPYGGYRSSAVIHFSGWAGPAAPSTARASVADRVRRMSSRVAGLSSPAPAIRSSWVASGAQNPPTSSRTRGLECSPSCDQVATSASSSSVPSPPGRATNASERRYMSCLRSCIEETSCSSVRPVWLISRANRPAGITPMTAPPWPSAASGAGPAC